MVRAPFYDENGLKKGAWSIEEDERLKAFVLKHGHSNWRQLPKLAGLARCGKSCRLRWLNYLRPNLKHGSYTEEEEEIIIKLHRKFGNKWSLIAEKLPGRTDNEVKNHWHSHLKKSSKNYEITTTCDDELKSKAIDSVEENLDESPETVRSESPSPDVGNEFPYILESSLATSEGDNYSVVSNVEDSNMDFSISKEDNVPPFVTYEEFGGDFWTQPFLVDDTYMDEICSGDGIGLLIPNFDEIYLL